MTAANRRAALGALDRVRPLVDSLHRNRPNEELAADLAAAWEQTEVVLRALLGGTALNGQQLVRELRQRELVSLDQAHHLLNFHAARDRAGLPGYQVAAGDVSAARDAVATLDAMLGGAPSFAPPPVTAERPAVGAATLPPAAPAGPAAGLPPSASPAPEARRGWRGIPPAAIVAIAALLLLLVAVGGWWIYANRVGGPRSIAAAEQLYATGSREAARRAFAEIASEREELALPHVYLARIARENGDVSLARQELERAILLEPTNALAQREMGSLMLATGNPDLARRFYTRAVQLDADDRVAQGYLGCALMQLGQADLARRFIDRAGPGDWQACLTQPVMPGGMFAPGITPPGVVPPGGATLLPPNSYQPPPQ